MSKKVLHITNWYHSDNEPKRALWIKDQINLWRNFTEIDIWHVELTMNSSFQLHLNKDEECSRFIFKAPIKSWFLIELLSLFMLAYLLIFKVRMRDYQAINFHVAYPLLTYWHLLAPFVRKPVFVSEHWSAYHFHFNTNNPLKRIKRIFQNDLSWIVVSKALGQDLMSFSENSNLKFMVLPNVVDLQSFDIDQSIKPIPGTFFMVSQWKDPKDPFLILKVFKELGGNYRLRIGGYGPQVVEMRKYVKENALSQRVDFLGSLGKETIRREMNASQAFIHCSKYETFSVVCAEAISCGCPVLASDVGGIKEFINGKNGVLVSDHKPAAWVEAIRKSGEVKFNRNTISSNAHSYFALEILVQKLKSEFEEV